ncbi:MAG: DUF4080 domain-containing protein, partial [Treponema sp.]|nr:DUF4080 domain-containing protein [Treponema sp.]
LPEIQPGILKSLPGTPISRHNEEFGMRYSDEPPYDIIETSVISADDIRRIKNFARFWELLVNRYKIEIPSGEPVFNKFLKLSDTLFAHFDRNWGIVKMELLNKVKEINIFNSMD